MKLWPSDSFEIETKLSPEEALAVLSARVEPRKIFRRSSDHTEFEGVISQDGFKITRIIHYGNSFLPVITGKFSSGKIGTTVSIRMRLHRFVTVFMCFWCGGLFVGTLACILSGSPLFFVPMGMILFGWGLTSGGFWFEAKKQKPVLLKMFKAET